MPRVTGDFFHMHQDSQDYGSDDEHMVSRVFFTLAIDGNPVLDGNNDPKKLYADVKLPVGGSYASDLLEVGVPVGFRGPFDHAAFAKAATKYVCACVGSEARGIRIGPGAQVRMRDNHFGFRMPFEFTVPDTRQGTW